MHVSVIGFILRNDLLSRWDFLKWLNLALSIVDRVSDDNQVSLLVEDKDRSHYYHQYFRRVDFHSQYWTRNKVNDTFDRY